jgi:hypothetical protein
MSPQSAPDTESFWPGDVLTGVRRIIVPQSSAALRQQADTLRLLRNPHARPSRTAKGSANTPERPLWAKRPLACAQGLALAAVVRGGSLWILVRDAQDLATWRPAHQVLATGQCRDWARTGF